MSDEAILRIIAQDGGSTGSSSGGAGTSSASGGGGGTPPVLSTPPAPSVYNPTDPLDVAKRRVEQEEFRRQVDAEYAKLVPPTLESIFDPVEMAKKRLEADKQRAEIDAEYAKLKPPEVTAAFDPKVEARKRREKEQRAEQIDAAYKDMYGSGKSEKGMLDKLLDVANSVRGTLGGVGGPKVGAMLDVAEAFRKAQGGLGAAGGAGGAAGRAGAAGAGSGGAGAAGAAGAAGGASGGMGAAMAAAGPAAAVVAAVLVAMDSVKSTIRSTISAIGSAANFAASSDSDPASSLDKVGDAANGVADKLTYISPLLSVFGTAVGESIKAFAALMHEIDKTADRYGEYSPEIAQAQAIAEIRLTLGDLRRSREVETQLARYVQTQAEMQEKFEDIKVKLLVRILPVVTRIMEKIDMALSNAERVEHAISSLLEPLSRIPGAINSFEGTMRQATTPEPTDPTEILFGPNMVLPIPGEAPIRGDNVNRLFQ